MCFKVKKGFGDLIGKNREVRKQINAEKDQWVYLNMKI